MLGQGSPNCSVDATMLQFCWSLHLQRASFEKSAPYTLTKCTEPWILSLLSYRLQTSKGGVWGRLFRQYSHLSFYRSHSDSTIQAFFNFNSLSILFYKYLSLRLQGIMEKTWIQIHSCISLKIWSIGKVCTNLGNSTAPRCTFRFRDTGPPRKSRCARPPNRNYDNCTWNRHVSKRMSPQRTMITGIFDVLGRNRGPGIKGQTVSKLGSEQRPRNRFTFAAFSSFVSRKSADPDVQVRHSKIDARDRLYTNSQYFQASRRAPRWASGKMR